MSHRRLLVSMLALGLMVLLPRAALKKEDIQVHKLDNGLKILLLEDHDIPNIALYTFFRVGARNEHVGITGVSHFIEHMMFNGTEKVGPGEFDRRMEFLGGANNAYTGQDMTAYTDWFPAAGLEDMLGMEADRMQGLLFAPKVLESERGVIASERRMSTDNNNDSLLNENVQATAIMAHPYHWDVIGWMSDIQHWTRDAVLTYYHTYYAPNNAVMVLVGDFDSAEALKLIQKYYAAIPAGPPPPPVTTTEPPQMGTKRVFLEKKAQTPSFEMVFHAAKSTSPDFPALRVLDLVLLTGESSRMNRRLVRDEQLAVRVGGGIYETIDPFLFSIRVKPRPGTDLNRLETVIVEELDKVKRDGITADELQKAINMIRSSFYQGMQTIAGKANILGRMEVLYGDYTRLFTAMDDYRKLTPEAVRDVARKYFTDRNMTVGTLVPEGDTQ